MTRILQLGAAAAACLILTAGGGHAVATAAAQAPAGGLAPEARAQIAALLAEKRALTPTQRKIDSRLLHAKRQITRETSVLTTSIDLPTRPNGKVELELRADMTGELLDALRGLAVNVTSTEVHGRSVVVDADLQQIEQIAALPGVHFVRPKPAFMTSGTHDPRPAIKPLSAWFAQVAVTNSGSVVSEGDVTHKANLTRSKYGVDGTGIKIGVLSDGVTHLATSQGTGDLGTVTVLPGQTGNGDEGTAMLEIIHDLAPGAQLFFATADPTPAQFAQNIRDLRTAGCSIIVDDVGYFVETPFQDGQDPSIISPTNGGVVAQAVKDVTAAGALYFSSAANSGSVFWGTSGTWEGDFVDSGLTDPFEGANIHSFGGLPYDVVTATTGFITLQWSDPLGAAADDYDLFRLDSTGTMLLDFSADSQVGTQDPFEEMGGANTNDRIVVVKVAGASRFLHLDTNRGQLTIATNGSTHGHADTSSPTSFSVAATPAGTPFQTGLPSGPYPNPFNAANLTEFFSSDGPRHIFFTPTGAAITPGNLSSSGGQILQKPDFTAADGVSDTGAGGFPTRFYGTSAAAPHAAAIAALAMTVNPCATPTQVRGALISSAIDIHGGGFDVTSGAGILMADTAAANIIVTPTITGNPGNATIVAHTTTLLSVTASGPAPVTYQWYQGPQGNTANPIGGATSSTFTTPPLDVLTDYWVRVTACGGSADSATAVVSVKYTDAGSITDPVLTTGLTVIKAVHITELRTRIDALRLANGLTAFPWTDPTLSAHVTIVKAVHITELRTAISQVYTAKAMTPPTFTGTITSGTAALAQHIAELRAAVTALGG